MPELCNSNVFGTHAPAKQKLVFSSEKMVTVMSSFSLERDMRQKISSVQVSVSMRTGKQSFWLSPKDAKKVVSALNRYQGVVQTDAGSAKAKSPIRALREKLGMSQKELAEATGLISANLSVLENGKRPVTEKMAKRLSGPLSCPWAKLVTR